MQFIYNISHQRLPWVLLASTAFALVCAALYFQHMMDLQPCVKCIIQRTAVIGVFIAALLPIIYMHRYTRLTAYGIWAYSAFQGLMSSREHLEVIFASNPFLMVCDIVPNFPSFLPLYEWIPSVFEARGECNDNTWQFFGMGMASWMQIIFAAYLLSLLIVVGSTIITKVGNKLKNRAVKK